MATAVVLIAVLFWVCVFVVCFSALGVTPIEFFFGRYEPLPEHAGEWREAGDVPPTLGEGADLVREERWLLPDGRANASYLVHQVRYRDRSTRAIVHVEPEQAVRRRRVSARKAKS